MVNKVIREEWQTSDGRTFEHQSDALRHEDRLKAPERYAKAYGTWQVTTEGDVEGRSTRQLGTYTGYLDEIAFALADKCYYTLEFTAVNPIELDKTSVTRKSVAVKLNIESKTWDMDNATRVQHFYNMLEGRNVNVVIGGGYCAVTLEKTTFG